jgi:hypothetical protein
MDFEKIQEQASQRIAELGELLSVSDQIAKGERRANRDQMSALKLSIDCRLRLLSLWKPQDMNVNVTSPVRIIYDRLASNSEDISRLPVAGSQE